MHTVYSSGVEWVLESLKNLNTDINIGFEEEILANDNDYLMML